MQRRDMQYEFKVQFVDDHAVAIRFAGHFGEPRCGAEESSLELERYVDSRPDLVIMAQMSPGERVRWRPQRWHLGVFPVWRYCSPCGWSSYWTDSHRCHVVYDHPLP